LTGLVRSKTNEKVSQNRGKHLKKCVFGQILTFQRRITAI
jgi:hypothetical protein